MGSMADGQDDEDYGYQICLVQVDGINYPQLFQPVRHELPSFSFGLAFFFCFQTIDGTSRPHSEPMLLISDW